jgi:uracil phosphoribosyltransferase
MVYHLAKEHSILNTYVNELRDINIQSDRARFRKNMERIGQIIAMEISKKMSYTSHSVTTPLATYDGVQLKNQPIVGTILRAGIPLFDGILSIFDHADCAFVAAFRKHTGDSFRISQEYVTCPELTDRVLILADPMLATGASLVSALQELKTYGIPSAIHVACAISSQLGIELVAREFPDAHIWTADIDEELTAKGYIVPGLGDAGDLSYGNKMQF